MHITEQSNNKFKTMNAQMNYQGEMNYQAEMQSQINSDLSLYIPHVFPNFTKEYIAGVFEDLEIGIIDHVDLVAKMDKNGNIYNAAYVHFSEWFKTTAVANFQERVVDLNREARIVHDDPWYWIILENTAKKYEPGARKPTLDLSTSGDEEIQEEESFQKEEPKDYTEIQIAPGLSQIILSPKKLEEINELIEQVYNQPQVYQSDTKVDDEITRLKTENQLLHSIISMHAKHTNECHSTIEFLKTENKNLNKYFDDQKELLEEAEEMLDQERQDRYLRLEEAEEMLDQERQDNFIKLYEAEEMLDQERMEKMLLEESHKENMHRLLLSILNSNSLDEAREKAKGYLENNF